MAFELLKRLCPVLGADDLQIVLSESVLTCLKQNLKKEENYLHVSARKCVKYLYSLMKRDSISLESKSVLSISIKQFSAWIKGAEISFDSGSGAGSGAGSGGDSGQAQFKVLQGLFYASFASATVVEGEHGDEYVHNFTLSLSIPSSLSPVR